MDAEADRIIRYWEQATSYKPAHHLVVAWLQEHDRPTVIEACNKMLSKYAKEQIDAKHQYNYVAKVLRDQAAKSPPATSGQIDI